MTDLTAVIHELVGLFGKLQLPYAIMGGMPLVKVRLYLEDKGIDADIFLVESDFQQEVMRRCIVDTVEGLPVTLISAEDLVLFKLLANRPRDLLDVADIFFMQGHLDERYMRRWAMPLRMPPPGGIGSTTRAFWYGVMGRRIACPEADCHVRRSLLRA